MDKTSCKLFPIATISKPVSIVHTAKLYEQGQTLDLDRLRGVKLVAGCVTCRPCSLKLHEWGKHCEMSHDGNVTG